MTESHLMRMTAVALLVWVLSCLAIYVIFVAVLGIPAMTAVVVVGLTVLVTAPCIAIATARNFRRVNDNGVVDTEKPLATLALFLVVLGFGLSTILVLSAVAGAQQGRNLGSAVMAGAAVLLMSMSAVRLRRFRGTD